MPTGFIPDPRSLLMPWWLDDTVLNLIQTILAFGSFLVGIFLGGIALCIANRQKEIQEAQHKFFEEQIAKKTDLRIIIQESKNSFGSSLKPRTTARFHAHNGGTKSADGFYWELLVPESIAHFIKFIDPDGEELESKISHQSETEHYRKIDGHYTHKLWGYTGLEVTRISFDPTLPKLQRFSVRWRIRGEEGMVPPEGLAFITLKREGDMTYTWSRWHPGQKESESDLE